jgi:uncharacterized protein
MTSSYETIYHILLNACEQTLRILEKAEAHVASGASTEESLLHAKLASDMFPFTRQVQIVSDNVKNGVARLAGVEAPVMEDTETTLTALKDRIVRTRKFVEGIAPAALKESEHTPIHLKWMPEGMHYTGSDYATLYIVQNTLFHVVTAYDILRMSGVHIGKSDYIGPITMHK